MSFAPEPDPALPGYSRQQVERCRRIRDEEGSSLAAPSPPRRPILAAAWLQVANHAGALFACHLKHPRRQLALNCSSSTTFFLYDGLSETSGDSPAPAACLHLTSCCFSATFSTTFSMSFPANFFTMGRARLTATPPRRQLAYILLLFCDVLYDVAYNLL